MNENKIYEMVGNNPTEEQMGKVWKEIHSWNCNIYTSLLNIAAAQYDVMPQDILEKDMSEEVTRARNMYFYALRKVMKLSCQKIAEWTNYTRGSVDTAISNFERDLANEDVTKHKYNTLLSFIRFNNTN